MLYKKHPWKPNTSMSFNMTQLSDNIQNDALVIPDVPEYSFEIKDLLKNILEIDEANRLTWNQIS